MKSYSVTVDNNDDYRPRITDPMLVPWTDHLAHPPGTRREVWSMRGRGVHCEHGPAIRIIHPSGVVACEYWYLNGKLTATTLRDDDGQVTLDAQYGSHAPGQEKAPSTGGYAR